VAGIKGLQGVVRKTVNDELQAIIWEPQHMDKLIPSMLFNMQDAEDLDRYLQNVYTHMAVIDIEIYIYALTSINQQLVM
jgi:hypothetical protein